MGGWGGGAQVQAIAMIYSIVAAVCVLDVVSARREQRASFALAYRQARGGRGPGGFGGGGGGGFETREKGGSGSSGREIEAGCDV